MFPGEVSGLYTAYNCSRVLSVHLKTDEMNEAPGRRGIPVEGNTKDLFESAAPYYAQYRRPYPPAVISHLVEKFGLDGRGRLLDVGCGTGQVFQVLEHHFEEITAIDSDLEMVRYAMNTATACRLDHVAILPMRGEDIDERLGSFRMVTFGASFHWMDRSLVGDLVFDRLHPGGHLVVLSPSGIHSGITEWEAEVRAVIKEWLGPERRAGQGVYRVSERHHEALRRTRFREVEETDINVLEEWPIDHIVGYLFSTSYASKAVLGEKAADFECAIRERLLRLRPDGQFEKAVEYTVTSAARPR